MEVCDVYGPNRRAGQKIAGAKSTGTGEYRAVLDRKDIDAVLVASPLHLHARHFLDTVGAGKDLYCEKTMTWSIPEAEECLAAAHQTGRVVQIGLQHESSGSFADARQWVKDGLVGQVTEVVSWMSRNTPLGVGQWVRSVHSDCDSRHVRWDRFLDGRPHRAFDGNRFIKWRLFWEFSGGNITENLVHQIAYIMSVLDLPLPSAAYMNGGIYSEKDGREVPDTIAVSFEFPELVVTWQSTFSNKHYGLGEHFLGRKGTLEHVAASTDMVTGLSRSGASSYPEEITFPDCFAKASETPDQNHMGNFMDCVRSRKQPNAPVEIGYSSAVACHMANLAYRYQRRVTLEEARTMVQKV